MSDPQPIPPPQHGVTLEHYSSQNVRPPKPARLIVVAILGIISGGIVTIGGLGLLIGEIWELTHLLPEGDFTATFFPIVAPILVALMALGLWVLVGSILCLR